ncbi:MAG: hypothetical protein WKF88_06835 [Ferruginibacter sp.]
MKFIYSILFCSIAIFSCKKTDTTPVIPEPAQEDIAGFAEVGSITLSGVGAAEITAYDPSTKRLFVVTNAGGSSRIDIVDLANPSAPALIGNINILPYGSFINSVSVFDGKLAAALEGTTKTDQGKIVIFKTSDYSLLKQVTVGPLPDMVTFSADGKYIVSANEGEPNDAYTIDPVGTVSIITVADDYAVVTVDFASFASQFAALQSRGLRIFGPGATFAQDIEPEYVTISSDSRTAWVTLQENNAFAKIDLPSKSVTAIFPLGFKNYSLAENSIDPSDKDLVILPGQWNVKGMYHARLPRLCGEQKNQRHYT